MIGWEQINPLQTNVLIRFGRWNDFKSRLICWITKSEYSHSWIEYDSDLWQGRMIAHSIGKGVIIESYDSFVKNRGEPVATISYKAKVSLNSGFYAAKDYLGKDYPFRSVIKNSILLLLQRIGLKGIRPASEEGKYSCSEFVALFLRHAGIYNCELSPEHIWPGRLEEYLSSDSEIFRRVGN